MGYGEIRRTDHAALLLGGMVAVGMVKLLCSLPVFSAGDVEILYFEMEQYGAASRLVYQAIQVIRGGLKMKKLLTVLVAVLLILAFVGCNEQADNPTTPEEMPPVLTITPEPTEQANPTPTSAEAGVIIGDILFHDIPVSQLFTEPFLDVLGEPISQHGAFFSFEGLSIVGLLGGVAHEEEWAEYDNVAIQLDALAPHLDLFTLNGVPLDMTRAELIATFGAPYHDIVDHDHSLMYPVSSSTIEYTVTFRFESSNDDAPMVGISIGRSARQYLAQDERWDETIVIPESVPEQLVGTWRNGAGHIVEISADGRVISVENGAPVLAMATLVPCYEDDPESEFPAWEWRIRRVANGTYVIECCQTHLNIWFFPVGVEMVRDTNWSLVPSDTSRDRMFLGTFSLTACCPNEKILREVFYRTTE